VGRLQAAGAGLSVRPRARRAAAASIRTKPSRDFDARDRYLAALDRDTLEGYEGFFSACPGDPMAPRVRAIIAARREAITASDPEQSTRGKPTDRI
jgi:hypothetical protein